jgi:hypothetical protein
MVSVTLSNAIIFRQHSPASSHPSPRIHASTHLRIHAFMHSFIHSCIHSCIHTSCVNITHATYSTHYCDHAPRTMHHAPRTTHHAPRTTHHAPRTTHHAHNTPHRAYTTSLIHHITHNAHSHITHIMPTLSFPSCTKYLYSRGVSM